MFKSLLTIAMLLATSVAFAQEPEAATGVMGAVAGFFDAFPAWIVALTTVVTGATAITTLTPTKKDDKILSKVLKVLNVLAGNVGKNKNKVDT